MWSRNISATWCNIGFSMPHKYGFSMLTQQRKAKLASRIFFCVIEREREREMEMKCFEFRLRHGKTPVRAANSHNKFRCGISERIAKLATTGFPREKLARHVISFIARHVHAGLREIFTAISGRNWYCDSPFVTLHIMYVPHMPFFLRYGNMTRAK